MTNVLETLKVWNSQNKIECIPGCGQCCPPKCKRLVDSKCTIHPKLVGEDNRGPICRNSPLGLSVIWEIPCPAFEKAIKELTGETPIVVDLPQNREIGELSREYDTESLESLLNREVS